MKKPLLILLAVAIPLSAAAADLTVTYKYKGGGSGERSQYYSDRFQLTADKGSKQDTLVDLQQEVIYLIDHRSKTIQVMKMADMSAMMGGMGPMMEQMSGTKMPGSKKTIGEHQSEAMSKYFGDPGQSSLEKLGPQQVAGRTCEAYRVQRKGDWEMIEEVCVDAGLVPPGKVSPGQQGMAQAAKAMSSGSMEAYSSPAQKELNALPGLALKRKTKIKGMATEEEAILVKEGPIDPTLFQLPPAYQQIDQASYYQQQMLQMQQQMRGIQGQ